MSNQPTWSRRALLGCSGLFLTGPPLDSARASTGGPEDWSDDRVRWLDTDVNTGTLSTTVVDETVYTGTVESGVVAYETSGERRWSYEDTARFRDSAPCVVDGVCYAKDTAGSLYALDATTGDRRWKIEEAFPGNSSPTVYQDRCYVSGDETLAAVDTFSGEIEWTSEEIHGPVSSGLTIADGRCFVSGEGGVTAHDLETGAQEWSFEKLGYSDVVIQDGTVYGSSDHGAVYALNSDSGTVEWSYSPGKPALYSTPTLDGDHLIFVKSVSQDPPHGSATELLVLKLTEDTFQETVAEVYSIGPNTDAAPTVVGDQILWTIVPGLMLFSMKDGSDEIVYLPKLYGANGFDPTVVSGVAYMGSPDGVIAIDLGTEGSSSGHRVKQGITGHHHSWAETASLEIFEFSVTLEDAVLAVGEKTCASGTITFTNGREETELERMTFESADSTIASVDADGTVHAHAPGTTDIGATYRGETTRVRLVVADESSIQAVGVVGTAMAIGSGAYLYCSRN